MAEDEIDIEGDFDFKLELDIVINYRNYYLLYRVGLFSFSY